MEDEQLKEWRQAIVKIRARKTVPAPIVWTRFCNSGRLSHGISLSDFNG